MKPKNVTTHWQTIRLLGSSFMWYHLICFTIWFSLVILWYKFFVWDHLIDLRLESHTIRPKWETLKTGNLHVNLLHAYQHHFLQYKPLVYSSLKERCDLCWCHDGRTSWSLHNLLSWSNQLPKLRPGHGLDSGYQAAWCEKKVEKRELSGLVEVYSS